MCALTFAGQGKCGAFDTVLLSAVLLAQYGEVDNLTNGSKNLTWFNVIIAVQKLQYVQEKGEWH
jgi:hypothetical protein